MRTNSHSYTRGRGRGRGRRGGRRGGERQHQNKVRLTTIVSVLERILTILPGRIDVRRLSNEMHSRHGISHSAVDFVIDRVFDHKTTISKDTTTGRCMCGEHSRGLCKKYVAGMLDATKLHLRVVERGERIDPAKAFRGADILATDKYPYPRSPALRDVYALGGEYATHHLCYHFLKL